MYKPPDAKKKQKNLPSWYLRKKVVSVLQKLQYAHVSGRYREPSITRPRSFCTGSSKSSRSRFGSRRRRRRDEPRSTWHYSDADQESLHLLPKDQREQRSNPMYHSARGRLGVEVVEALRRAHTAPVYHVAPAAVRENRIEFIPAQTRGKTGTSPFPPGDFGLHLRKSSPSPLCRNFHLPSTK
jgi:hypothetical protein